MADYTLYYWPIQFRGQFIRAVLAYAGASWVEAGYDATLAQKALEPNAQLIAHMGPPVLTDHAQEIHISQMSAILAYLGEKHRLLTDDPVLKAMTHKIIGDANDVLYEMTRYHGVQMWTDAAWNEFLPRLERWMRIFEDTGQRYGLTARSGYILGTQTPCLADLVTATLWGGMTARIAPLRPMLNAYAPVIAGLCDRMAALPSQVELQNRSDASFGNVWCGGEIEASLCAVVNGP